jgi:hypothetical protein
LEKTVQGWIVHLNIPYVDLAQRVRMTVASLTIPMVKSPKYNVNLEQDVPGKIVTFYMKRLKLRLPAYLKCACGKLLVSVEL